MTAEFVVYIDESGDEERWPRLFGQKFVIVKWSFADVGLSTAPLAAP